MGRLRRLNAAAEDLKSSLTVLQAASICGITDQAIRNWIGDAARIRRPIAEKRVNAWIIDTLRMLAYLEKHRGGPSAKALAEARLLAWLDPLGELVGRKLNLPLTTCHP
jgi:hypothetical protein